MISDTSVSTPVTRRLSLRYYGAPCIVVCILLFSGFLRDVAIEGGTTLAVWRDGLVDIFSVATQSWMCGSAVAYFLFFTIVNWKTFTPRRISLTKFERLSERNALWIANLLLLAILGFVLSRYVMQYKLAGAGTDALVLLTCVVLHQWLIWLLAGYEGDGEQLTRSNFINLFMAFACISIFLTPLMPEANSIFHGQYRYHDQVRWSGIWLSPNLLGLIMSVVVIFSLGRTWNALRKTDYLSLMVWSLPMLISSVAVIKSYSRGAWAATACGVVFLMWNRFGGNADNANASQTSAQPISTKKLMVWGGVGLVLGFVLVCGLRFAADAQVSFVQRILAAFGDRDFSSQNRLASYQDGINMLMDHPYSGYGWDNLVTIHSALYLQSGLSTGDPIKLNEFLVFALRFGIPIFAAFLFYIWVWLSAGGKDREHDRTGESDILLCRTATLMLAIGFMFTDGFFRLATGGSFWLFLTLSFDFAALASAAKPNQSAG